MQRIWLLAEIKQVFIVGILGVISNLVGSMFKTATVNICKKWGTLVTTNSRVT